MSEKKEQQATKDQATNQEPTKQEFFRTCPLKIKQYNGAIVEGTGVVDETQTLVAVAIARVGQYTFRATNGTNLMRTPIRGDVAVHAFEKTGEYEKDGEIIIEGKIGAMVMESKGWMTVQFKDPSSGIEQDAMVRTPWSVATTVQGSSYGMSPPSMASNVKKLVDEAINLASLDLEERAERGDIQPVQSQYARAANAAANIANKIQQQRQRSAPQQQGSQRSQGSLADAVTGDDLEG